MLFFTLLVTKFSESSINMGEFTLFGLIVTATKIYKLSFGLISIFLNSFVADLLPSTFILKAEALPLVILIRLIFKAILFRLYSTILEVALPKVVKTVSKVSVSVENSNLYFGSDEMRSSLHE